MSNSKSIATNIDVGSSKSNLQTPKLDLEISGEGSINLDSNLATNQNSLQLSESISGIYKEVGREARVTKINKQLEDQYLGLFKKQLESREERQKVHVKNFQDVKEQFKTENQSRSNRGKREVVPQIALTQSQRDSISRMFHLYHGLQKESKKLSEKLEEEFFNGLKETLLTDTPTPLSQTKSYSPEDIKRSLMAIGWTGRTIRTHRNLNRRGGPIFDANSWGTWDKNPFRHFYSEESEFKKDIEALRSGASEMSQAKSEQSKIQSRMKSLWSHNKHIWGTLSKQLSAINKRMVDLEASQDAHIVNKIAMVLLKSMGQLS